MSRYRYKSYFRIPGGEVQFGHISHNITIWWRGRRFRVWGWWR